MTIPKLTRTIKFNSKLAKRARKEVEADPAGAPPPQREAINDVPSAGDTAVTVGDRAAEYENVVPTFASLNLIWFVSSLVI